VLEHGPPELRQYGDRNYLLSGLRPAEHLVDEPGRVLRWSACGMAAVEPGVRAYFHSRREDDSSAAEPVDAVVAVESAA
jgi:hypothetical protein